MDPYIRYPFDGRTALITGAASGIGRAAACLFARSGARVVLADLPHSGGDAVAEELRAAGRAAQFVATDVSQWPAMQALAQAAEQFGGRIDFFFNNAGIEGALAPTSDYPQAVWERVMAVNLTGVWHGLKAVIPRMVARGGGAIVNSASIGGLVGVPLNGAYAASKHGVIGLTRTAALEYASAGVRVNAICPGQTQTAMVTRMRAERPDLFTASPSPLGRAASPEEIAEAVLWLSSDAAAFVTGQALVADGGVLAS